MSVNGLGLGAIRLLYLARDVALNLNCLTLLHPLLGTYILGQEGACVMCVRVCVEGRGWASSLTALNLIFLRHRKKYLQPTDSACLAGQ